MTTLAPELARWLGAADASVIDDHPWEHPDVSAHLPDTAAAAVLTVSGMPRAVRRDIESAMVVCVPSGSQLSVPGADPLTAEWFTAWRRSVGPTEGVYLACRQVLTGTPGELAHLNTVVSNLATRHHFTAELVLVD